MSRVIQTRNAHLNFHSDKPNVLRRRLRLYHRKICFVKISSAWKSIREAAICTNVNIIFPTTVHLHNSWDALFYNNPYFSVALFQKWDLSYDINLGGWKVLIILFLIFSFHFFFQMYQSEIFHDYRSKIKCTIYYISLTIMYVRLLRFLHFSFWWISSFILLFRERVDHGFKFQRFFIFPLLHNCSLFM